MGNWWSTNTEKTIDSNGNINNNLVFEGPLTVQNTEVFVMVAIICVIKIIEVLHLAFRAYTKNLKKKYSSNVV